MIQGREPQAQTQLPSGSGSRAEPLSLGQLISAKCQKNVLCGTTGKEQPQKPGAATRTPEMFKPGT